MASTPACSDRIFSWKLKCNVRDRFVLIVFDIEKAIRGNWKGTREEGKGKCGKKVFKAQGARTLTLLPTKSWLRILI